MYIDKLDDIVNEYNNTYHKTIKMKPIDVNSSIFMNFVVENNDKDPKFEVCADEGTSKYKNIFAKGHTPN